MSVADVGPSMNEEFKNRVMHQTWGHLAPEPGRKYRGDVLFAHGEYGDLVVLRDNFDNLPGSPWFKSHLDGHFTTLAQSLRAGTVATWRGTYTMLKNGSCRFSGKFELCLV